MTKQKIHTYENLVSERMERTHSVIPGLQDIYSKLKALGAENIDISDIQNIVNADGNAGLIKELILRGKDLRVGGMPVDVSFLKLPEDKMLELSRQAKRLDGSRSITWRFYGIENGKVICLESAEEEIRSRHTVFGTAKTQDVVADVEKICELINKLGKKIGVTTYHPLRSAETWFYWDATEGKYVPDIPKIANYVL